MKISSKFFYSSASWGKIQPQVVAVILLTFGVSLLLSAYRSLGREFAGVVIAKSTEAGFSSAFWVFLIPPEALQIASGTSDIPRTLQNAPRRRVGISRVVYGEVREMQSISKSAFSPFVFVDGERHLDLGLQWFAWGLICLVASIITYRLEGISMGPPVTTGSETNDPAPFNGE